MTEIISWWVKSRKTVDSKEVLRCPLFTVSLSKTFPDESKRLTGKRKLLKELGVELATANRSLCSWYNGTNTIFA